MEQQSLRRIMYVSTATGALGTTGAEDIRARSEVNNERDDITGLLAFGGGSFLQLIEGPVASVDDLFARLVTDKRHTGIEILLDETATQRFFHDWQMAYLALDVAPVAPTPGALAIVRYLLRIPSDDRRPVVDAFVAPFIDGSYLSVDEQAA